MRPGKAIPQRGADDPRPQARRGQGSAAGELSETSRRSRLRCADACRGSHPTGGRQGVRSRLHRPFRRPSKFEESGRECRRSRPGRGVGGGASLRARGGARACRPAGRHALLAFRRGGDQRSRAGHRTAEKAGVPHAANLPVPGQSFAIDRRDGLPREDRHALDAPTSLRRKRVGAVGQ